LNSKTRAVLLIAECANKLGVTDQHILNLIEEGKLSAIDVGGGSRHFYRVPVAAWEDFLKRRASV
jgi:excisionase family DNA binding protein